MPFTILEHELYYTSSFGEVYGQTYVGYLCLRTLLVLTNGMVLVQNGVVLTFTCC